MGDGGVIAHICAFSGSMGRYGDCQRAMTNREVDGRETGIKSGKTRGNTGNYGEINSRVFLSDFGLL